MPEPDMAAPDDVEAYLVEIDRRLRGVQRGLAPEREPAPVREARVAPETPRPESSAPPDANPVVTSKLISSMRELLDALESATAAGDRPATY